MQIYNGENENSIKLLNLLDIPVKELARDGGSGWVKSNGKADVDEKNKFFGIFSQYIGREVVNKQHFATIERWRDAVESPLLKYKDKKNQELLNLVKSMSMNEINSFVLKAYWDRREHGEYHFENENLEELFSMAYTPKIGANEYREVCENYPDKFRIEKCTSDLNDFLQEFGCSYLNWIALEDNNEFDYRIIENMKVEAFLESNIDEQYTGDMVTTNINRLQMSMNKIQHEDEKISQEEKDVIDILTKHIACDLSAMFNECPKRVDMKDFDFKEYKKMIDSKFEKMGLYNVYEAVENEPINKINEKFEEQVWDAIKNRINIRDEKSENKEQNEIIPEALASTITLSTDSITSSDIKKISEIVNRNKERENSTLNLQNGELNR